jgi:hypothetical protein
MLCSVKDYEHKVRGYLRTFSYKGKALAWFASFEAAKTGPPALAACFLERF